MQITVNVKFEGAVEVVVPDGLPPEDARLLAEKLALAKVVAVEGEDGPEEEACDEYVEETGGSEDDWDNSMFIGVSGNWTVEK